MTDQPALTWVRLHHGRLWHTLATTGRTDCGETVDRTAGPTACELTGAPPINAWICTRCARTLMLVAREARTVWLRDPRRDPGDTLPAPAGAEPTPTPDRTPPGPPAASQPAQKPEVPAKPDPVLDLVSELRASVEAARARRAERDPGASVIQLHPTAIEEEEDA